MCTHHLVTPLLDFLTALYWFTVQQYSRVSLNILTLCVYRLQVYSILKLYVSRMTNIFRVSVSWKQKPGGISNVKNWLKNINRNRPYMTPPRPHINWYCPDKNTNYLEKLTCTSVSVNTKSVLDSSKPPNVELFALFEFFVCLLNILLHPVTFTFFILPSSSCISSPRITKYAYKTKMWNWNNFFRLIIIIKKL